MTVLKGQLAKLAGGLMADPIPGAPPSDFTVAPTTGGEAAALLEFAARNRMKVLFWGGGTHQGYGHPVEPDLVMATTGMDRVLDWQAEDLTIAVEPGLLVSQLDAMLEQRGQTAVLPENSLGATVGGVVAAGLSGWRRLRYGPTRDRVLEVELATGDGRLVRGGGRLVKNVTGYDLPRLVTGSYGSLGLIVSVCLKLWPLTAERAMLEVTDPEHALRRAYRPHAVIETNETTTVYLAGTREEIAAQAKRIGGTLVPGHRWPPPLPGSWEVSLRIPPAVMSDFVDRIRKLGLTFQAAHGTGEILFVVADTGELAGIREAAEGRGGSLVVSRAPNAAGLDPWGSPPGSCELQRRVKMAFDPVGAANPGILPGGI